MDIHYSTFFLPIDDAGIDGIITSPPYSVALNYVENDAHALKELWLRPRAHQRGVYWSKRFGQVEIRTVRRRYGKGLRRDGTSYQA